MEKQEREALMAQYPEINPNTNCFFFNSCRSLKDRLLLRKPAHWKSIVPEGAMHRMNAYVKFLALGGRINAGGGTESYITITVDGEYMYAWPDEDGWGNCILTRDAVLVRLACLAREVERREEVKQQAQAALMKELLPSKINPMKTTLTIAIACLAVVLCFAVHAQANDQDNAAAAADLYATDAPESTEIPDTAEDAKDAPAVRMPPQQWVKFGRAPNGHVIMFDETGLSADMDIWLRLMLKLRKTAIRSERRTVK